MLRIAVPNKGSLSEAATTMLGEAGYRQRRSTRELALVDPDNDVEFFYLRPRDIAVYVGSGTLDLGITGRDLLLDSQVEAQELLPLGFGASTFRFASLPGRYHDVQDLAGARIATSYAGLVGDYLHAQGVEPARIVRLDGAIETSIRLGVADAIADVVSTGTTLRAAGLEIFGDPLMHSEALLIGGTGDARPAGYDVLERRLQGVLVARRYVMVDYDIPLDLLEAASAVTPGLESPTVSPLRDPDWVAVRSMMPEDRINRTMDELYDLGARAILVTNVRACRI